jgi:dCTP diphosphatase
MDVSDLTERLRSFSAEREWEHFHYPKNLAMALAAEAGELLEVFQWKTTDEVRAPWREPMSRPPRRSSPTS